MYLASLSHRLHLLLVCHCCILFVQPPLGRVETMKICAGVSHKFACSSLVFLSRLHATHGGVDTQGRLGRCSVRLGEVMSIGKEAMTQIGSISVVRVVKGGIW